MKTKKRFIKSYSAVLCFLLILLTVCFSACGSKTANESYSESSTSSSMSGGYYEKPMDYVTDDAMDSIVEEEFYEEKTENTNVDLTEEGVERKIIKTANLNLETQNFDATLNEIKSRVSEFGGYISSSSLRGNKSEGSRYANFVCRIPADNYEAFLSAADDAGNVTYLNENEEDVTNQYIDLDARIKNLEAQYKKLNELLDKAETLDEMLTIENYIYDIQYQLDSYKGRMKSLTNQITYCTVSVSVSEVTVYTAPKDSFLSRIGAAFGGMWGNFLDFLQDFSVFFIYAIPYIILAVIALIVIKLIKKKKRAKKALNKENKVEINNQEQNL